MLSQAYIHMLCAHMLIICCICYTRVCLPTYAYVICMFACYMLHMLYAYMISQEYTHASCGWMLVICSICQMHVCLASLCLLQEQAGRLLKTTGHTILLTSICNISAFLIAAILPIPALRMFALQVRLVQPSI